MSSPPTAKGKGKEAAKEVVKEAPKAPARALTPREVLFKNIDRLQKAASTHDSASVLRILRCTAVIRHTLPTATLLAALDVLLVNVDDRASVQAILRRVAAGEDTCTADACATVLDPPEAGAPTLVPLYAAEVAVYLHYIATSLLVKRAMWEEVVTACTGVVGHVQALNKRTLDVFGAKFWAFLSLAHERLGTNAGLRAALHDAYRTACLRHDDIGQATLLNLLVRNFLSFNLYAQANKLISKASLPEGVSNNQHIRFLYYKGRIQVVQLDYTDGLHTLTHADRKTPMSAPVAFRATLKKALLLVQLLLGEIPERGLFEVPSLKRTLAPYLALTQAVRVGDIGSFNGVLAAHERCFVADRTLTLVTRLRQNVIKAGLRKIWSAYSRISFADIAAKLRLDSAEDAEFLCAKAIRDGVVDAVLHHDGGYLCSNDPADVYSSTEPQAAFDPRIRFCLGIHAEAVKAMSYPAAPGVIDTRSMLEREKEDLALAEEVDNLDDMDDGDDL